VSEDDERRAQDDIQKLTDRYVLEVDKLLAEKRKRLDGCLTGFSPTCQMCQWNTHF